MVRIVYSLQYDMGLPGFEHFHPFDLRKYGKAWHELEREFGPQLERCLLAVDRAATDDELLLAHTAEHLQRMQIPSELAKAFEVPAAAWAPFFLLDAGIVTPMRWGVRGTILAVGAALSDGCAVNLSGGYHHAKPDEAEGFSLFSDIAIAVRRLRTERLVPREASILYIDCDAHQGNGVCHQFLTDRRVKIYDQFNADIYPQTDDVARDRIDHAVPLAIDAEGPEYLSRLHDELPAFLASHALPGPALAIYNAGSDVLRGDRLGMLSVSEEEVVARDLFVVDQLRERAIPTVMVLGGGYTSRSYQLVARSVGGIIERHG